MEGAVAVGECSSWLEEGWDAVERDEVVGDSCSLREVEEVEKGDLKGVEGDGGSLERGRGLLRVYLDGAHEGVDADGERTVLDEILVEGMHEAYFEDEDGFSAECYSRGMSEGGGRWREVVEDGL